MLCCLCLLGPTLALAQAVSAPPNRADRVVGETIANRPSTLYRFERHSLGSADGKRHYRIEISIPRAAAPDAGYPVLYMLDGNAAMDTLTGNDLAAVSASNPPVLVAIGYDTDFRNDVVARSYDYTPPVYDDNGTLIAQPIVRGRLGGGADIFLQFIISQIKPLVRERAAINPNREYLWGHSYGGLFTLYTLFMQPDAFSRYIAGDPSAWWHDGALMHGWHAFNKRRAAGKRVAILVSGRSRAATRALPSDPAPVPANSAGIDSRAAVKEIAKGLRQGGALVTYEAFPQYGHGDMIRVSLERALQIAVEP
ncbi:alpha/beta hydrolase [Alcaligenaceae bacterium]|nr:alpha/beta hydrolase [Alcaligenaceae bacterium]